MARAQKAGKDRLYSGVKNPEREAFEMIFFLLQDLQKYLLFVWP